VKFPGNLHSAGVWVQYDWFRVDSWTDPVDFNHIEDPLWTDHGPRRHLRQRTRFATVSLWIRTSSKKNHALALLLWGSSILVTGQLDNFPFTDLFPP
jgi:hypothetical protein